MISNRFKTEQDREWHTKTQFETQISYDKARSEAIKNDYGLECARLSQNVITVPVSQNAGAPQNADF